MKKQDPLIFGKKYKLWRDGEYIGIATWTEDVNIGDSFIELVPYEGHMISKVYKADKWELIDNEIIQSSDTNPN